MARRQALHNVLGLTRKASQTCPTYRLYLSRLEGRHLERIIERARLREAN
jgi:hypothetical protein